MTEDQDILKQEIINTMNINSIDIRLNKVEQLGNKFAINIHGKLQENLSTKDK